MTCEHGYIGPCAICDGSGQLEPTWSYFLESETGETLDIMCDVPYSQAPQGDDYRTIDGHEIKGYWHPCEP